MAASGPRVAVIGGSLGGLNAALFLRDAGCNVDVYERSPFTLESQGAGVVMHPSTVRYFVQNDVLDIGEISVAARFVRYMDRDGGIADQQPCNYRFTSYNTLYGGLLGSFDEDRYHLGEAVAGFEQDADGVSIRFASGREERCDLMVCADGIRSTGRRLLARDAGLEYAGYVAWRAKIGDEVELSGETRDALREAITYYVQPEGGHILSYSIPGLDETKKPAKRLTNWLWYRNVAAGSDFDELMTDKAGALRDVSLGPGTVQERQVERLREDAEAMLPPPFAELVLATPEPFVQAVFDVEIPRMVFGRVCIIGDAAFTCRPHIAVGTAKAAEDAFKLGEAVREADGDVDDALKRWEPGQLDLGRRGMARTRDAGRRFQDGTWPVGDPLPYGLYEVGDSSMSRV